MHGTGLLLQDKICQEVLSHFGGRVFPSGPPRHGRPDDTQGGVEGEIRDPPSMRPAAAAAGVVEFCGFVLALVECPPQPDFHGSCNLHK